MKIIVPLTNLTSADLNEETNVKVFPDAVISNNNADLTTVLLKEHFAPEYLLLMLFKPHEKEGVWTQIFA